MKKYLVGGAVRNLLLKIPIKERDWVIIGSTPEDMKRIGYRKVGKDFPVFLHPENHEEYALARTERKSGQGYTGFTCYTSPNITLEEDLYRRDLTINAIACDEQGNIIDPYNGKQDIQLRILRHVSILFKEDPLRVLRVARFAAQFAHLNFKIAPSTLNLMKQMTPELSLLSQERIWMETKKALMTNHPQIYFQVLKNCNALKIIFPEINDLFGNIIKFTQYNLNIDLGEYTMTALKTAAHLTNNIATRFAVLCNNLNKINKQKNIHNINHNNYSDCKTIDNLCKRIKTPNYLCRIAKLINKYYELLYDIHVKQPEEIIKFFNKLDVWRHPERLNYILTVGESYFHNLPKFRHQCYLQKNFLLQAYSVSKYVDILNILKKGFTGKIIKQEINKQRYKLLNKWKITQNKNK
ncbi:multifunctional CCA addition/repair protein [Blochmannia endosymbiont of Camponotus (Colobopsis) obliquus]|uniref:multifunctional CCA addition/repair protein n=1 Tax=Blochmannia endosymbiont of Camponotus (Colobopsis) obliquus TaxID=1505597 RepID=UPI00061A5B21|nr:multifunctional CCA addition/repair protein [Blochmannia endosymbiont of Camponotus (Colobopsis) obliquus]AKC60244.1 multifunctional CCA protein [Blochmannia endosymbiont of Camponotus (Colobopsis) obliquus]